MDWAHPPNCYATRRDFLRRCCRQLTQLPRPFRRESSVSKFWAFDVSLTLSLSFCQVVGAFEVEGNCGIGIGSGRLAVTSVAYRRELYTLLRVNCGTTQNSSSCCKDALRKNARKGRSS